MTNEQFAANISGAIFDFAGYLTTMKEAYTVGAAHEASRMAHEAEDWLKRRGVNPSSANVQTWQDFLDPEDKN